MNKNNNLKENLKKKLLYRARYRGMKEMDILVNRFVESHFEAMGMDELLEFEIILNINDQELKAILLDGKKAIDVIKDKKILNLKMLEKFIAFHRQTDG